MTELTVEATLGHSPRKEFIRDFYAAVADADVDDVLSRLTDDVRWTIVGETTVDGAGNVEDLVERLLAEQYAEIRVDTIITHGYDAAANGRTTTESGDTHAFCEVFTFDGATRTADIEAIESYVIETE